MSEHYFDHLLDTSGLKCPLPVIRARKIIKSLSKNVRLKIISTDPLAEIDIPLMAQNDGHIILENGYDENRLWFILEIKASK